MIASFPAIAFGSIPGFFPSLLDAALRSLLVAGAVWAGLRLLRAHNVVAQKAAWGLVLAGALLMPVAAPWAARLPWLPAKAMLVLPAHPWLQRLTGTRPSQVNVAQIPTTVASSADAAQNLSPAAAPTLHADKAPPSVSHLQPAERFPAPTISNSPAPRNANQEQTQTGWQLQLPSIGAMLWLLYFAVFGGLLLRLLYGLGAAAGMWRSAQPVDLDWAPDLTAGLRLRSTNKLHSPVTVGSGILLPADYAQWDAEKLRIVLAHERSHVHQRDFYLQLCAGLYAALFWFSPLGWWLKRKLSDLSEAISDRAGLTQAASRASYAKVLLEFAAMPRTTQIGVAMARSGRLTHRIERLLNESSFRQSFAGGRHRMLVALLIPAALFAATALIRVEAAVQAPQTPAPAQSPVAPIPPPEPGLSQPEVAPTAAVPPVPPSPVSAAPSSPVPPLSAVPELAPLPPLPALAQEPPSPPSDLIDPDEKNELIVERHQKNIVRSGHGKGDHFTYSYNYDKNGDSYALIKGDGKNVQFSGDWQQNREALEKAKRMAHGDFLWFSRNGKSYILRDPEKLAQIESMYKPMEELGKQQEELGRQQEVLGREQEKLGRQQEQANIPTPDISREMADLNAAVAKMQSKKGAMLTQEQLSDLESKIGELQGKLGDLQGEIGAKMGTLGGMQGKLGDQQGKLGEQQGRLGAEQGRIAGEADKKVKSIIDESLKNGKARPVE